MILKPKVYWISTFNKDKNSGVFYRQLKNHFKDIEIEEVVFTFKFKNILRLIFLFLKTLKKVKSKDIIHSQFGSTCGFLGVFFKTKKIITLRGSDILTLNFFQEPRGFLRKILTLSYLKYYDEIIVVSNEIKNILIKWDSRISKKITVLPSAVDKKKFYKISKTKAKNILNLDLKKNYIFFPIFNHDYKNKNYEFIKKLNLKLKKEKKNIQVIFANNKINHHEMIYYYNASSCVILASNHEGWPNVLKEAIFCDVPIVSSNVSDLKKLSLKSRYIRVIDDLDENKFLNEIDYLLKLKRPKNFSKLISDFEVKKNFKQQIKIYNRLSNIKNLKLLNKQKFINSRIKWFENLISDRFGNNWKIQYKKDNLYLRPVGQKGSIKFDNLNQNFLKFDSNFSCYEWNPKKEGFKSPLGKILIAPGYIPSRNKVISKTKNEYIIDYDVLGLIFWTLNRLEEIAHNKKDKHNRFYAGISHAKKYNYLDKPIIDEWLEILKQVIKKQWPSIKLKKNKSSLIVSQDIDRISRYFYNHFWILINLSIKSLLRFDFKTLHKSLLIYFKGIKPDIYPDDPYNTFDWTINLPTKVLFNFICGGNSKRYDPKYSIFDPVVKKLIKKILKKGHSIGLHPSYHTYNNLHKLKKEYENLKKLLNEIGYSHQTKDIASRMHYLRYEHPKTLGFLDKIGIKKDMTMGYSDCVGFRSGTCFDYQPYDPIKNKILDIKISPLIFMDSSISNVKLSEKTKIIKYYLKTCKKLGGNFSALFHNSDLTLENKLLLKNLIKDFRTKI